MTTLYRPFSGLWPLTLSEIAAHYKDATSGQYPFQDYLHIVGLSNGCLLRTLNFTEAERNILTIESMKLANNQINEACNKFYATVQLAHAVKDRTFVGASGVDSQYFSGEFILGGLIPVLYYSQIATLLSLLSCYGIVFARDSRTRRQRSSDSLLRLKGWVGDYEFLLARKREDWSVHSRTQETGTTRWHKQLICVGERFFASGTDANIFDFGLLKDLKKQRDLVDYSVLGRTSMAGLIGFETYLKLLPRAYKNIGFCLEAISRISGITNNCDDRIRNLENSILAPLLFEHPYSIRLELWKEMPSKFTVKTS